MGNNENASKKTARRRRKRWRDSTKVYFFSALVVFIASIFASLLSLSLPAVPLEVSTKVLENVIRLDGVLFGFSGVMLSIVYREIIRSYKDLITIMVFSVTSFLCYLLSIFMSFSFLMSQTQGSQIFIPVLLTCFGGLCSSVYIVMAIIGIEQKE